MIHNERPEPNERVPRLDCDMCQGSGRAEYYSAGPQSYWDFCQGCEGLGKRMTDEMKPWGDEWLSCGETEGNQWTTSFTAQDTQDLQRYTRA